MQHIPLEAQAVHGQPVQPRASTYFAHDPAEHISSTAHTVPHPPQLTWLRAKSKHPWPGAIEQIVSPVPQGVVTVVQRPSTHLPPAPQPVGQVPQKRGSPSVSTQTEGSGGVAQFVSPGLHEQTPPLQYSSFAQILPQAPQFFGSIVVSLHTPAQSVSGDGHLQSPAKQTRSGPHVPQEPQPHVSGPHALPLQVQASPVSGASVSAVSEVSAVSAVSELSSVVSAPSRESATSPASLVSVALAVSPSSAVPSAASPGVASPVV